MKFDKKGLESKLKSLKKINKSEIKFGIFGRNANKYDDDRWTISKNGGRIKIGHLARILEEGRTFIHKGGIVRFRNHAGEERVWRIKPGTLIRIPSRPFFTFAFIKIKKELPIFFRKKFIEYINSNTYVERFLYPIGDFCSKTVKDEITNFQGNISELQAWKKGNNKPLSDSGKLLNAVDYEVKYKNR